MATFKRINSGRGHWYKLDDRKLDGVTWAISNGVPKGALVSWAARMVAEFLADRPQLVTELDREELIDLCKGAPYRERDAAANRGTEVHGIAERLARGEEVDVPAELQGHIEAYLQFREDWQPTDEILEFSGYHTEHLYAGTGDLIATLVDGSRWLLDIKTNRSGPFGEVALQLAAYRNFTRIVVNGEERSMEPVDRVGVIWLRADGYDLVPFDTGPDDRGVDAFRAFLYVLEVARWTQGHMGQVKGDALMPLEVAS
jgi:hypothetical protein